MESRCFVVKIPVIITTIPMESTLERIFVIEDKLKAISFYQVVVNEVEALEKRPPVHPANKFHEECKLLLEDILEDRNAVISHGETSISIRITIEERIL